MSMSEDLHRRALLHPHLHNPPGQCPPVALLRDYRYTPYDRIDRRRGDNWTTVLVSPMRGHTISYSTRR